MCAWCACRGARDGARAFGLSILLIETRHKSGHGVWGRGPGQREQGCAMREEEILPALRREHPERRERERKEKPRETTTRKDHTNNNKREKK